MKMRVRSVSAVAFIAAPLVSLLLACFAFSIPAHAVQTIPYKMNFQGRLNDATGNPMAAGNYNMKFRIYSALTGGTLLWSEQRANSASTGVVVTTGGLFSVQLGDVVSLPPSIFNNASAIYFEIELPTPATATCTGASCESYTEGPMTPRNPLGSSAYAFNSDTLDGLDSAAFAQVGNNTTFTATLGVNLSSSTAFSVTSGATSVLATDTANGLVKIGTTDSSAQVLVLDSNASDPGAGALSTNGAMYYNSGTGKFRCYQGGWLDCIPAGASTTLQGAYDNSTSPATITTTATKGITVVAGAAPTADMFTIDNSAKPTTTAGVSGIEVNYAGGAAAVEASGIRVDYAPGTTSGGTWNGLRIVANPTGAVSGVNENGLKIEGPTTPGAGNETGLYIGTGWDAGLDIQSGGINLAGLANDPSSPGAGNLRVYAKSVAGRMMLKWKAPSGVESPLQTNLGFNNVSLWTPATGTTAVGTGFGVTWPAVTGTITHPKVANTNVSTSIRAMQATNVATTTNQILGLTASTTTLANNWRGNAAGLGGFFMHTRFKTNLVPASTIRLFVGLTNMTTGVTAADSVSADTVGLSHYTTDSITTMTFMTYDGTTVTRTPITVPTMASDNAYDFTIYSPPNGSVIYYRLVDLLTGNILADTSTSTTLPRNTVFMGPQVQMSNGTANLTAATTAIGISRIYLESDN